MLNGAPIWSRSVAATVLRAWKCEVYVATRGAGHRALAGSLGATWVGAERDRPPVELDRAVTFAPSGDVVVAALARLRKGDTTAGNADIAAAKEIAADIGDARRAGAVAVADEQRVVVEPDRVAAFDREG